MSNDRSYPVVVDVDADGERNDKRFTFGLMLDVAEVLAKHDYPKPTPADLVQLQSALFRFIYQAPCPVCGGISQGHTCCPPEVAP